MVCNVLDVVRISMQRLDRPVVEKCVGNLG